MPLVKTLKTSINFPVNLSTLFLFLIKKYFIRTIVADHTLITSGIYSKRYYFEGLMMGQAMTSWWKSNASNVADDGVPRGVTRDGAREKP